MAGAHRTIVGALHEIARHLGSEREPRTVIGALAGIARRLERAPNLQEDRPAAAPQRPALPAARERLALPAAAPASKKAAAPPTSTVAASPARPRKAAPPPPAKKAAPPPPAKKAVPPAPAKKAATPPAAKSPESGAVAPEAAVAPITASPAFPYESHFVDVFGSEMHYIEQGSGDPILFLHGNPSWAYVWRNVIPHLSPLGRCIAPDLIGFGKSGKPDIEYRWFDHARYLERFIDLLELKNITLVVQDQGSGLGFHYAMRHQDNVKGIAFFEAMVKTYPDWETFPTAQTPDDFRQLFKAFRSAEGWDLIVEQNVFIDKLFPQSVGAPVPDEIMSFYRAPFFAPETRRPIWRFPQEIPIEGEPPDVWDAVSDYSEKLQASDIPKLLIHAHPGAILTGELVDWCKEHLPHLQVVDFGPGVHFLQESNPDHLGEILARWYKSLSA